MSPVPYQEIREALWNPSCSLELLPAKDLEGLTCEEWGLLLIDAVTWRRTNNLPFLLTKADVGFHNAQAVRWGIEMENWECVQLLLPYCVEENVCAQGLKWAAIKKNEDLTDFFISRANLTNFWMNLRDQPRTPPEETFDTQWLENRIQRQALRGVVPQSTAPSGSRKM